MYTAVTVAFLFLLALLVPVHHGHSNTGHLVAEAYEALHGHHTRRHFIRH